MAEVEVLPERVKLTFVEWLDRQRELDGSAAVVARLLWSLPGWPARGGLVRLSRWLSSHGHGELVESLEWLHQGYTEASRRPAFQPGHTLSLRHGAYSPRSVDPLAAELVAGVLADAAPGSVTGYLAEPAFRPALWAWGRSEAQAQLLSEYLARAGEAAGDGVGDLDAERVKAAYLLLHRAETRAESGRRSLGLDPLSRARLGRDVAAGSVDVARLMAQLEDEEGEAHG